MRRSRTAAACLTVAVSGLFAGLAAAPAQATDSDIRINEVQSNSADDSPDFVELTNVGSEPVDLSGWIIRDDDDTHTFTIAGDTELEPGSFAVFETNEVADGFGLGSNDMARLFTPDETLVDSYTWTDHAFTEGRVPDGTGEFTDTEPTPGAANVERNEPEWYDAEETIAVNEVMSDDPGDGEDWVELVNYGETEVDLSGWILRDDSDLKALPIAEGATLAPGEFLVIETNVTDDGFGLGKNDMIRVYVADGLGLVDSYEWTEHAVTEGRVPDASGVFVNTRPTPGSANVARESDNPIVINEIESNGGIGDWVELANIDTEQSVDLTGWTIIDGDPTHEPVELSGEIESGGYRAFETEPNFGLGDPDSATLRDAEGTVVDSVAWQDHAPVTLGRCPDMTGDFAETSESTHELPNACDEIVEPEIEAEPWPFADEVTDAVAAGTFGEDMSGIDIATDGTLYAVNNGTSELVTMVAEGDQYVVTGTQVVTYPDGGGQPDTEGVTVTEDGQIFASTERDNAAGGTSRPSVLRVDAETGTATHEWNLAEITGQLSANGGLEGIEWISDADATALEVRDGAGAVYDPAAYGEHFGGIFAVAVESTGDVHLVVLESDGTATHLQSVAPSEAMPAAMGLDWRAGANELWVLCDEACDNRTAALSFDGGELTRSTTYHAPSGMNPSFTNEGVAMAWCALDPALDPTVLWISDTAHDGVSLRAAAGQECVEPTDPSDPEPTDPGPTQPTDPAPPVGAEVPTPTPAEDLTDATRGDVTVPVTAERGETIQVTIPGAAGQVVHVWLHSDPVLLTTGSVTTDGTIAVTIAADATLGDHQIVVQTEDGTLLGWAPLELVEGAGSDTDGDGALATTGAAVGPGLGLAALAALLLGVLLLGAKVWVARRTNA
ncbi:lamin tail domain-containing protein [Ruania alba]|uniref:Esterase-like activity of phytase n=1 Tax=Ruania alba TaxID=648782 RepID=A0A1H5KT17_9MICO|nr:lamin tail domain-containing protein [Ruania alba]SEE67986.1 Esterase-like activity of phytase [Ruania alba]